MVATAQVLDRDSARGGARPSYRGGQGDPRQGELKRTQGQNKIFHALCTDISRSPIEWMGCRRTAEEWKVLLVSGHAVATGRASDLVRGLEGELVQLRESTASMSVGRSTSLIEYTLSWAVSHGVKLRDPR
jgi:hypothetical protein